MKTKDFVVVKEDIAIEAGTMHKDHEVQMAREECYHTASNAIKLHGVLKHISELDGIPGWVSEKITLAHDYMQTVLDYMEYDHAEHEGVDLAMPPPPVFSMENAEQKFDELLNEMTAGATGGAAVGASMGGGNGFVNGGPGTVARAKKKKARAK